MPPPRVGLAEDLPFHLYAFIASPVWSLHIQGALHQRSQLHKYADAFYIAQLRRAILLRITLLQACARIIVVQTRPLHLSPLPSPLPLPLPLWLRLRCGYAPWSAAWCI